MPLVAGSMGARSTGRHGDAPRSYRAKRGPRGEHVPEGGQVAMPLVAGSTQTRSTSRQVDTPRSYRAKRNPGGGHAPEEDK